MAKIFTSGNFQEEVLSKKGLVVVDFFAEWCGPCKMMAPSIEKLAEEFEGKATIGKLDVDASGDISQQFDIQSIPTVIYFKDGQVVDKSVGFKGEPDLRSKIQSHI